MKNELTKFSDAQIVAEHQRRQIDSRAQERRDRVRKAILEVEKASFFEAQLNLRVPIFALTQAEAEKTAQNFIKDIRSRYDSSLKTSALISAPVITPIKNPKGLKDLEAVLGPKVFNSLYDIYDEEIEWNEDTTVSSLVNFRSECLKHASKN